MSVVVVAPAERGWGWCGAGCCGASVQAILGRGAGGTRQLRGWAWTRCCGDPVWPEAAYQASFSFCWVPDDNSRLAPLSQGYSACLWACVAPSIIIISLLELISNQQAWRL